MAAYIRVHMHIRKCTHEPSFSPRTATVANEDSPSDCCALQHQLGFGTESGTNAKAEWREGTLYNPSGRQATSAPQAQEAQKADGQELSLLA